MRAIHLMLLVLVSCSSIAPAERATGMSGVNSPFQPENEDQRYLRGRTKPHEIDEERAIRTPQLDQASSLLKLPKLSKLPGIKHLNKFRLYLAKKAGNALTSRMKKRYDSNPNNFI
ncbi:secreted RxLR effector peptide protein, putative [Phytophthora infestans T30-4]|uniref:Secreted RxLR effector peptide protein, putative n=2 Tax=Phytophthora infestans TaxID=4787 RepID=D0N921_PHYIT|nr:secreted RxLR effector peptide protein, putative [Phytophthora infestans T30-4]EEY54056.1 secreted RxLR effector peptide protein, putative [Phytophthora infestans T30-4]KAF4042455.1 hypothetical protein GN244_ATG05352 [Phytophthora infestans]|eukprot:XP_002904687.1 secreted RxLR effector peptide protein, putative [Phytophthora infestans T30-4]